MFGIDQLPRSRKGWRGKYDAKVLGLTVPTDLANFFDLSLPCARGRSHSNGPRDTGGGGEQEGREGG